jgi:hypothetical protein
VPPASVPAAVPVPPALVLAAVPVPPALVSAAVPVPPAASGRWPGQPGQLPVALGRRLPAGLGVQPPGRGERRRGWRGVRLAGVARIPPGASAGAPQPPQARGWLAAPAACPGPSACVAVGLPARACQRPGCSEPVPAVPSGALAARPDGRSARRLAAAAWSARLVLAGARPPRACAAPLRARSPWTPLHAARGALNALLEAAASLARRGPDVVVAHLRAPAWGSLFRCHGCSREPYVTLSNHSASRAVVPMLPTVSDYLSLRKGPPDDHLAARRYIALPSAA